YEMNLPDDADIAAVADSPHATGLRHLSLDSYSAQGPSDLGLTALASSPFLGQLGSLGLGPGTWGAAGARALGRSRSLTSLRTLQLTPGHGRDRSVAKAFLGQPLIRRLRHLKLSVNSIGKKGLAALASHPRPLRLREL